MKCLIPVLSLSFFSLPISASPTEIPQDDLTHFSEEIPTSELVKDEALINWNLGLIPSILPEAGDEVSSIDIDKIINTGKKIWAIVEAGKPVVNIRYDYANALPKGARAADLIGFSDFNYRSFRFWGKNLYGITVYDITYTVVFRSGGSYEGQGRYLEGVAIIPQKVDILWGYSFDMKVRKVSVLNVGTKTSPVAAMTVEASLKVSTVIKSSTRTSVYGFRGDRRTAQIIQ